MFTQVNQIDICLREQFSIHYTSKIVTRDYNELQENSLCSSQETLLSTQVFSSISNYQYKNNTNQRCLKCLPISLIIPKGCQIRKINIKEIYFLLLTRISTLCNMSLTNERKTMFITNKSLTGPRYNLLTNRSENKSKKLSVPKYVFFNSFFSLKTLRHITTISLLVLTIESYCKFTS